MFEMLPESLQVILMGALVVLVGLLTLANAYPDVAWLRPFRVFRAQPSEAQAGRLRRRVRITAAVELIGLGLLLPVGYLVLTVMFFSQVHPATLWLTLALAALSVAVGIWILFRGRTDGTS